VNLGGRGSKAGSKAGSKVGSKAGSKEGSKAGSLLAARQAIRQAARHAHPFPQVLSITSLMTAAGAQVLEALSDEAFNALSPDDPRRFERKDRKNKREQQRRKDINDRVKSVHLCTLFMGRDSSFPRLTRNQPSQFNVLAQLLFGSKLSGRVDKTQILDKAIQLVLTLQQGQPIEANPTNDDDVALESSLVNAANGPLSLANVADSSPSLQLVYILTLPAGK
jgi:hypothetical protein